MTNVVILTRDRPRLLRQCIDSLMASDGDFLLSIVDDETTDEDAREYMRYLPIRYRNILRLSGSGHNIGKLKSTGVEFSEIGFRRGDWLCIADNDCCFHSDWLDRMIKIAVVSEQQGFVLWGGQNHPFHKLSDVKGVRGMKECESLAGTHFFMRWETWDKYEPLVSRGPGTLQFEDVDFCDKIREDSGRIGVADPFCVVDTGLTGTDGTPSPGVEEKQAGRVKGLIYE